MDLLYKHLIQGAGVARLLIVALAFLTCGCPATVRKSGQIETFHIHLGKENTLVPAQTTRLENGGVGSEQLPINLPRTNMVAKWGDAIKFERDVVTIRVESVYLHSIPATLTGSHDVVLFAEVWENAALGPAARPLTSVVYQNKNEIIPGKLNFSGKLAYGPTSFKGHPLTIKFTLMVLQKEEGKKQSTAVDVVRKYAEAVPVYGQFISQAAAIMRDMLAAQPDVVAFDFETGFLSIQPEKLSDPIQSNVRQLGSDEELSFDKSFGWLSYGLYALVETNARTNAASSSRSVKGEGKGAPGPQPPALNGNRFNPDNQYFYSGGWIHVRDRANPKAEKKSRLDGNYIVYSIVPGQISETDEALRTASETAVGVLQQLRQTEENTKAVLTSLQQGANLAAQAVIQSKAKSLAEKLSAKEGQTFDRFKSDFDGKWAEFVSELGPDWNDPNKDEIKAIRNHTMSRYEAIFESLKIKSAEGDAQAVLTKVADAKPYLEEALDYAQRASNFLNSVSAERSAVAAVSRMARSLRDASTNSVAELKMLNQQFQAALASHSQETDGAKKQQYRETAKALMEKLGQITSDLEASIAKTRTSIEGITESPNKATVASKQAISQASVAQLRLQDAIKAGKHATNLAQTAQAAASQALVSAAEKPQLEVAARLAAAATEARQASNLALNTFLLKENEIQALVDAAASTADVAGETHSLVQEMHSILEQATQIAASARKTEEEGRARIP